MEQRNTSLRLSNQKSRPIPRDIAESLGKLPPQSIDLEEAILGALMLEKNAFDEVTNLKAEHFYSEQHQEIFSSMARLRGKNEPIDMRTVVAELREMGKLELVGGAYYVAELTSKISSAANVAYHSRIVYEMWLKRELIQIASSIHTDAYEDTTDVFDLHDWASESLFKLTDFQNVKQAESIQEIQKREIGKLRDRMRLGGVNGLTTGFKRLNKETGGWQKQDLIILAARPGMGKSGFIGSSVRESARIDPVAVFSLEMSASAWFNRYLASDNEIELQRIIRGNISEHEFSVIVSDRGFIHELKLYIDDTAAISLAQLRNKVRRLVEKYGIKEIVIDYLQLMKGEGIRGQSREQEIATISRGLKEIAKEFDLVVIALCQLSREVEKRPGKRPQLSDLRESGAIEQDADVVIFLFRPEYYNFDTCVLSGGNGAEISSAGIAEVIIAKHRNGGLNTIPLKFIGQFTKFTDYEAEQTKPLFNVNETIEPKVDPEKTPF